MPNVKLKYVMTIIMDTREKRTDEQIARIKAFEDLDANVERQQLNYGDYTFKIKFDDGKIIYFSHYIVFERKNSPEELVNSLTNKNNNFYAELKRAKNDGAHLIILTENSSLENIIDGKYDNQYDEYTVLNAINDVQYTFDTGMQWCSKEQFPVVIVSCFHKIVKNYLSNNEMPTAEKTYATWR